jgi:hypothetical protein
MIVDEKLEGKLVRFVPPRWGEDTATVVQVNSDVLLRTSRGSFIREKSEIVEEVSK